MTVPHQVQELIDQRVRSGKYATPEDVLVAAVHSLEQQERDGDFAPSEWDLLLAEGEQSGPPLDGEAVFAELRNLGRNSANGG